MFLKVSPHQKETSNLENPSVRRVLNAGYAGRDQESVDHHIQELQRIGVPAPTSTPTLYPISDYLLTSERSIQVQHGRTSGEVEYVLFWTGDELLVTVGSDQTDRELESHSIPRAKQACPDVLANEVWRFADIEAHWDEIELRSWVEDNGERTPYQQGTLAELLRPRDWFPVLEERSVDREGTVFFSGTIATLPEYPIYGHTFEMELRDPVLERSITHAYQIEVLEPGIE